MTPEEAEAVLDIFESADDGCYICALDLMRIFRNRFPAHANLTAKREGKLRK